MITKEITIINRLGLHARAAAKFVSLTSRYQCDVQVSRNARSVNGKSIMGVMMLAASKGSSITLQLDGIDEAQALADIEALIQDRFGEEE